MTNLHRLQNAHWQAGVLTDFGGSLSFGRIRYAGLWVDIIRPADSEPNGKPGSFLMLPWSNRIRDAVLRFGEQTWQLTPSFPDGTAIHGDVRKRPWAVIAKSETEITLRFESADFDDFNFPFALQAEARYALEDADFVWEVKLINSDTRPFPAGFGFHPYFQHTGDDMPLLQVLCDEYFPLTDCMADTSPQPLTEQFDFREPRAITSDMAFDDLWTTRTDPAISARLIYTAYNTAIDIMAEPHFKHVIVFTAPDGTIAVEPQTNANDGFNLYANEIAGNGVFVVQPGESISGAVRLRQRRLDT